ncbi:MAG: acyl-[acyl-carrier-protein] thioesterase [Sarcina sp.]
MILKKNLNVFYLKINVYEREGLFIVSREDFKKQYEILYRDIDKNFNCRVTSLMDCLTDVGLCHEDELGIDISLGNELGKVFVFFEYDLKVYKYPKYREKIEVKTHVASIQKFYALRNFDVFSKEGELLAHGNTLAVMIDVKNRRLTQIPDSYYLKHGIDKKVREKPDKLKIEKIDTPTLGQDIVIRFSDLDSNAHINNAKYFEWSLDLIPDDILDNYLLEEIKIKFIKEILIGDHPRVEIEVKEINDKKIKILHRVSNKGVDVNIMETTWNKVK